MSESLPFNSRLRLDATDGHTLIEVPQTPDFFRRLIVAAFLACWLLGWLIGLVAVIRAMTGSPAGSVLLVWLLFWVVGGLAVALLIGRLVRKPLAERLQLMPERLLWDTGRPSIALQLLARPDDGRRYSWRQAMHRLFPRRRLLEFDRAELRSLQLREFRDGNRLTLDSGVDRHELAAAATEVEREWLYRYLEGYCRL